MKVERKSGSQERRILIGMVLNRQVLARIASKWDEEGLFESRWANLIGGWCVKHLKRYNTPPAGAIETRFERWAESGDKETVEIIRRFLSSLSMEAEASEINPEYTIDLAKEHFTKVSLKKLIDQAQDDLAAGNVAAAEARFDKKKRIELGSGAGIDVLQDREALIAAFEEDVESLIQLPGALGQFCGTELARDSFVSLIAPEKRGKSYWLQYFAWMAVRQRRKVAYFQAGDQSQNQVLRRLAALIAGAPFKQHDSIPYPLKIEREKGSFVATVTTEDRRISRLTWGEAWKAMQKACRLKIKSRRPFLKLQCNPAGTLSLSGIVSALDSWERDFDWTPDVILIDYADILALPFGVDRREGSNEIWQALRAMSEQRHCLVLTATQANTASYRSALITRNNFTEDKRKLAHVTGMIGINQTIEEKKLDVTRLNWVVVRDSEMDETRCVHVAGCRALGNVAVRSCW